MTFLYAQQLKKIKETFDRDIIINSTQIDSEPHDLTLNTKNKSRSQPNRQRANKIKEVGRIQCQSHNNQPPENEGFTSSCNAMVDQII
jgi:hypothetical protein